MPFSISDNFAFKGFDPTEDMKSYCKQVYCDVESKAPSTAAKTALIIKTGKGYEGLLRVVSASGTFMAAAANDQLTHLVDDLYSQFSQQISAWYNYRNCQHTNTIDSSF